MFDGVPPLAGLADLQAGAVTRAQLLASGMTDSQIVAQLNARRWQRIYPGVFVTFTGPLPELTRIWCAVLYAGDGAVASYRTAAWLQGIEDALPSVVEVSVPAGRRVQRQRGLVVYRSRDLARRTHPARCPPQTRIEETVLDLVEHEDRIDDVVGWITRACQRRRTTAGRIGAAAASRRRMRWRTLVAEVLADVRNGVLSPLERRWRRQVERAHGLPAGEYNCAEADGLRRRYRDVRYARWRSVVELDGRAAHPEESAHRDRGRDNSVVMTGRATLQFGWREVAADPCGCAAQTAKVLRYHGWTGKVRRCGPRCDVDSR